MEHPSRIGKYEIEEFLGGGMSHVYRAKDMVLGRQVALKILTEAGFKDDDAKSRFLAEARMGSIFHHDNIVAIYDFGEEDGRPYMVMEWLSGESLGDLLKRRSPLPLREGLEIAVQLARALRVIHEHKILHRDIKPENIHIDGDGRVKLMDFGIAKTESLSITRAGFTMGSPRYMAPEQILGQISTPAVDIWSFGVVLYEILAGKKAINGERVEQVFYAILSEPLDQAPLANLPKPIQELVAECTEKDPVKRIQSFAVIEERITKQLSPAEAPQTVPEPPRRKGLLPSLAGLFRRDPIRAQQAPAAPAASPKAEPEPSREVEEKLPGEASPLSATDAFRVSPPAGPKAPREDEYEQFLLETYRRPMPPTPGQTTAPPPPPVARSSVQPQPTPRPAPPPFPPRQDYREPTSIGDFTSMFQTAPAPPKAPSPSARPINSAEGVGEFTRFFQVGPAPQPGSDSAEEVAPDVALKITGCSDPTLMGQMIRLTRFPFIIGRPGRDYALSFDPAISRDHLEIQYHGGEFQIRSLGKNKTFVEDSELQPDALHPLPLPSRIRLGSNTELTFLPYRSEELPDLCGTLIGNRYRLTEKLGDSWLSDTYRGEHVGMGQPALVKILLPSLLHHPGYREQFELEAKTASSLSHPHITQVLDSGETAIPGKDRTLYVAYRYLEGGGLRKHELASLDVAATCFEKIASALSYVHAKNIIHGGIKPAAIVFDSSGNPYLTDFAMAVYTGDKSRRWLFGSTPFLAPEQWAGEELLPATDQYALAAVLYKVVTGAHPFEGQDIAAVRQRNYLQGAWPAHELAAKNGRPEVPAAVSPVLQRALSVNPADRFPSVMAFIASFRGALAAPAASKRKLVFISYHRAESSLLSLMLKDRLEADTSFEVFVDSEQQDSAGQFPLRLERKIQRCDAFVCLLAKGTLKAPWVQTEVQLAHAAKRPMIPVFQESFRFPKDRNGLDSHIRELIDSGGEKVWDLQNRHVRESIRTIIGLIRQVVDAKPEED